jgi:hypothetical protein
VANHRKTRTWALVAFGAETGRPTIVCIAEDAIPQVPDADWLVLARDTDFARHRLLPPGQSSGTNPSH